MPPRLRILITNDDGIYAPGIIALACTLAEIAEVKVVAPDRPRSAAGHSITLHKPLRMSPPHIPEFRQCDIEAWGTTGTPADCVILGIYEVYQGAMPDLVVSGINSGPNVGDDVTYSGTVAGAMEASLTGVPAMACSMGWFANHLYYWDAARAMRGIVTQWAAEPHPGRLLWNINLPNAPLADYAGVMFTHLGHRTFKDVIQKRLDPKGTPYYWIAGDKYEEDVAAGADTAALKAGYISITPIDMDMTHHPERADLEAHAERYEREVNALKDWVSPGPAAGEIPYVSMVEAGEE